MAHAHGPRLAHDLRVLADRLSRRQLLGFLGGAGLLAALGCDDNSASPDGPAADSTPGGSCARIPEETAGPYPGDNTNGQNALALAGIVRSDIRSSLGGATGIAAGVPLTVTLTILSSATCAPLSNRAVYLWHCDRNGDYSMYSAAIAAESYLRGIQITDADGKVTFTTIFPGCYSGRWPHIHFEIYGSASTPTSGTQSVATSQLALPKSSCDLAYAAPGYATSVTNLSQISLSSDNVFRDDNAARQLAATTGDATAGFTALLTLGISV